MTTDVVNHSSVLWHGEISMPLVPVELLAPIAFAIGISFGIFIGYRWAWRRGYDDGLEDGRSGR